MSKAMMNDTKLTLHRTSPYATYEVRSGNGALWLVAERLERVRAGIAIPSFLL